MMREDAPSPPDKHEGLLDDYIEGDEGLARELKKKPRTIQNWRSMGEAPPFIRLGKQIYYPKADVRKWLRARLVQVT